MKWADRKLNNALIIKSYLSSTYSFTQGWVSVTAWSNLIEVLACTYRIWLCPLLKDVALSQSKRRPSVFAALCWDPCCANTVVSLKWMCFFTQCWTQPEKVSHQKGTLSWKGLYVRMQMSESVAPDIFQIFSCQKSQWACGPVEDASNIRWRQIWKKIKHTQISQDAKEVSHRRRRQICQRGMRSSYVEDKHFYRIHVRNQPSTFHYCPLLIQTDFLRSILSTVGPASTKKCWLAKLSRL